MFHGLRSPQDGSAQPSCLDRERKGVLFGENQSVHVGSWEAGGMALSGALCNLYVTLDLPW